MTDKEKLEKIKVLADTMYNAAFNITTDASRLKKAMYNYHQFIINEYYKEEPVNNDLEEALEDYAYQVAYDISHDWLKENATWDDVETAVKLGAEWNERHHKPTWSEEDEKMFNFCCEYLDDTQEDWLKSIKQRIGG